MLCKKNHSRKGKELKKKEKKSEITKLKYNTKQNYYNHPSFHKLVPQ
jgi:hypothetical protein